METASRPWGPVETANCPGYPLLYTGSKPPAVHAVEAAVETAAKRLRAPSARAIAVLEATAPPVATAVTVRAQPAQWSPTGRSVGLHGTRPKGTPNHERLAAAKTALPAPDPRPPSGVGSHGYRDRERAAYDLRRVYQEAQVGRAAYLYDTGSHQAAFALLQQARSVPRAPGFPCAEPPSFCGY